MRARFKIPGQMLDDIRADLRRRHAFAHERVGFITAGATRVGDRRLLLLARAYQPVADEDYVHDPSVGAQIGPNAFAKALQLAYTPRSALIHVHSHGGRGTPSFSGVDLTSGAEFVPGLFNAIARYPHGMMVVSDDSATALLWFNPHERAYVAEFVAVGAPQQKFGVRS